MANLLNTLNKNGYLTKDQIANLCLIEGHSVQDALIESGLFSSQKLAKVLSDLFDEKLHKIKEHDFQNETLRKYKNLVLKHQILPLKTNQNEMLLAVSDPGCIEAQNDFRFSAQLKIKIALVDHSELAQAIRKLYGRVVDNSNESFQSEIKTLEKLTELAKLEEEKEKEEEINQDEAPVSQYIHQVLLNAIRKQASDIHFEPFEQSYQIRFRLDGKLQLYSSPPAGIARRLSSRIKIIAKLNIAERRLPQDGRLKIKLNQNQAIDMRVSTLPTLWGEKVVLRILNNSEMSLNFASISLSEIQKKQYLDALNKPQGMILVTGPTGSGKTVTLYTGLNYLNTHDRNISTAEDPVEIYLPGINQININAEIGLSFATALRALLRQDPDVLMLGEIRDLETAEIATKAAQTGHIVLSTLHTNSAAESISRLAHMGVAHYNIAASVILIIAQRLVRKLCPFCKMPHQEPQKLQALQHQYSNLALSKIFQASIQGCEHCNQGYLGRIGIFELISIDKALIKAIAEQKNANHIADLAAKKGMLTMQQRGIEIVNQGDTSVEELKRVLSL